MAGSESFERQLEEALSAWEVHVEEAVLPGLKQCYQRMRASFDAVYTLMKKKGLVTPDPYNYEERISDIIVPSDAMFPDSERDQQMSIRTAQYVRQLEYLTDYFSFSLASITMKEVKSLAALTRYINWQNLSENAPQPTTRLMAEQIAKARQATDQLSVNIIKDAQEQLAAASRDALGNLKKLSVLLRERYKLDVRRNVLPSLPTGLLPEELARQAKAQWKRLMGGHPFARDLIMEIAAEDEPSGGEASRQAVLQSLQLTTSAPKKSSSENRTREMLMESLRSVAAVSRPLEEISQKLGDNAVILQSRKLSFFEMIGAIWQHMRSRDAEGHTYEVEYIDEKTHMTQTETINFEVFQNTLVRRARTYAGYLARSGKGWERLQSASEDKVLEYVTREIQEVTTFLRQSESLDTLFRAEVTREQRARLRGINVELTAAREHVQRARKKAHEYVARQEEQEQLRRLGITTG